MSNFIAIETILANKESTKFTHTKFISLNSYITYITSRPRIFNNKDVLFNSYPLTRDKKMILNYIINQNMTNILK